MHTGADMPLLYHDSATNASAKLGAVICQAICPLPNVLICKGIMCDVTVICQAICPLSDVIMCQSVCDMTVAVICQQDMCPAL